MESWDGKRQVYTEESSWCPKHIRRGDSEGVTPTKEAASLHQQQVEVEVWGLGFVSILLALQQCFKSPAIDYIHIVLGRARGNTAMFACMERSQPISDRNAATFSVGVPGNKRFVDAYGKIKSSPLLNGKGEQIPRDGEKAAVLNAFFKIQFPQKQFILNS